MRGRDSAWPALRARARFRAHDAKLSSAAWSGRGIPCGGIMPPRSFRTTFSHVLFGVGACATVREIHLVEHQPGQFWSARYDR